MKTLCFFLVIFISFSISIAQQCNEAITTVSGTSSPKDKLCSGKIIFEENFDTLDTKVWRHENTLSGGGNSEFQWYTNNRTNSFVRGGIFHIKPSLTADHLGQDFLSYGTLSLQSNSPVDSCTDPTRDGCQRTGTPQNILNPIKSARISTVNSFSFKYGKIEISAKLPSGDWLIPEILMLPAFNAYGSWPASGEIDLLQSRGNMFLIQGNEDIGNKQITSGLHFGPYSSLDGWKNANFVHRAKEGFHKKFHLFRFDWSPDLIRFSIDGEMIGTVQRPKNGFWDLGKFKDSNPNAENPWISTSNNMAPFDQEFYIVIGLAVGGTTNFPDTVRGKPWTNNSPAPMKEFMEDYGKWSKTWNLQKVDGETTSFQIDYVKIYAL